MYKYFSPAGGTLESDNSIFVSGSYITDTKITDSSGKTLSWTTNERDLALVHYLAGGTRDSSFGISGIAITPVTPAGVTTSNATGSGVLIQQDGLIVEVGTTLGSSGYNDILLARYNSKGVLDTSFGGVGDVLVDLGMTSQGYTAVIQPTGQVVAAGLVATSLNQYGIPATWGFATVRLNTDGSLDSSFGTNGAWSRRCSLLSTTRSQPGSRRSTTRR